jgi:hypothetical protein
MFTVSGDQVDTDTVIGKVKEAGFEIAKIKKRLFGF